MRNLTLINRIMETTTITITQKRGKTIVKNDKGNEWSFKNMDEPTAIASLVFYTLYHQFNKMSVCSENFSISLTMESEFFNP